uniref:ABC transporter permease n=1 Tax=Roseburia sp. TaxID=2049040 RepID=UPI003FEE79FA
MSKNMITIIKKEFARFFGDRRMVLTTIFLPGIMIYVLYSFMGNMMMKQFTTSDDYVYQIEAVSLPASMEFLKTQEMFEVKEIDAAEEDDAKALVEAQEADLLLVFPEEFDQKVAVYDGTATTDAAPDIQIYYNSVSTESSAAYQMVCAMLDEYETALSNKFDINAEEEICYDMATEKDTSAQFFSMMLPMLMMMFLFSGCMAIAPESIAGEKERGTIATLLVTPMKRSELAIGKIISLSVIGLLSGFSSFVGTMLSLPNLMGAAADEMSASVYGISDYVFLLVMILSTVLVIIGAISVISGFAKSVKEAGTAVSPLMILVMVLSVTTMMGGGAPEEPYLYLIPLYNSVQCMNGIFSFTMLPVNFVITVVSNLVYTGILVFILTKMFDSEKIMYNA